MKLRKVPLCVRKGNLRVAEAVGCSYESIVQILSGRRNAPIKKLGKIAKALEVDPETLIEN